MIERVLLIPVVTWLFINSCLGQSAEGMASYYADKFEGRPTASGEKYRKHLFTAAHRSLAFGTRLRVTNLDNKREVVVTVNDRGPFVKGRILDLSRAAAESLGFINKGTTRIRYEIIEDGRKNTYFTADGNKIDPEGWVIQLGSFSQRANARTFANNIASRYSMDTIIEEFISENIPYYRVLAGPFSSERTAQKTKNKLAKNFDQPLIRKI